MFNRSLNRKFAYTLRGNTYSPLRNQFRLIYDNAIVKDYWDKGGAYDRYKKALRVSHYFGQKRRCAYCRKRLRAKGYWEDLDHVVSRYDRENWIFYPKNLILTCPPCNRLKNKDITLSNPNATRFPLHTNGFNIFNPHFDNWQDHFIIERGIFIKGRPGSKGPNTYDLCHLYRMDIIIDYVDETRIWNKRTLRRLTHRLRITQKGSNEEQSINDAIAYMIRRKKEN